MRIDSYSRIKNTITKFLENIETHIDEDAKIDSVTINYQAGHYECEVIISKESKLDSNKSKAVLVPVRRIHMKK